MIALVLLLTMTGSVWAITMTPSVDKKRVKPGDDVTVTITLDENIERCNTMAYNLYFDSQYFSLKSSENGSAHENMVLSKLRTDADGNTYYIISFIDPTSRGATIKAGVVYTLTFTASKEVTMPVDSKFDLKLYNCLDPEFKDIEAGAGAAASIKIVPQGESLYSVALPAPLSVNLDEEVAVKLNVSSESETVYNSYLFEITYDMEKLTYVSVSGVDAVFDNSGTLKILGFGPDKTLNDDPIITFKGKAPGEANVAIAKAFIDKGENADVQDTPPAIIIKGSTTITVGGYSVTLPPEFTGEDSVMPGEDYEFEAKDKNYDYDVSATMGGKDAEVIDNGDGTYTIKEADGPIVVTCTKTPKSFNVTVTGSAKDDVTAPAKATYTQDFVFTLNQDEAYDYTLSVTVGGAAATATLGTDGVTYTIAGADIVGDVVITAQKELKPRPTDEKPPVITDKPEPKPSAPEKSEPVISVPSPKKPDGVATGEGSPFPYGWLVLAIGATMAIGFVVIKSRHTPDVH